MIFKTESLVKGFYSFAFRIEAKRYFYIDLLKIRLIFYWKDFYNSIV